MPLPPALQGTPKPAPKPKPKITTKPTAIQLLERSSVTPKALQQELLGEDVGIDKLAVYLSSQIRFDLGDRIVDASISRTIGAASVLSITINDYDRGVLQSGYLYNKLDVQIDGMWFRLTGVDKSGDELTLTFEDREIAVLRTYNTWKMASRKNVTRAQFVLNLINEVKEFKIPYVIPELVTPQLLQTYDGDPKGEDAVLNKRPGIDPNFVGKKPLLGDPKKTWLDIYVKNPLKGKDDAPLNKEQIRNASTILSVGQQMSVNDPKINLAAITAAIAETNLVNTSETGDGYFNQVLAQLSIVETPATIAFMNRWAIRKESIKTLTRTTCLVRRCR
jgi:hypothetical protein